ncbi:MAG: glycosyltransferase family 9 protein [Sphingomonadales bacterium]|nr:glycosyltransferase family 9 protein [Sphingomonadales bacterium]
MFKKKIIQIIYFLVNDSLELLTKICFSNKRIASGSYYPNRILIMRNGSIGDSITAFPAIVSIKERFPEAKIDIITNSGSIHFVGMEQLLDTSYYSSIINYYGWGIAKLFKVLKAEKYDLFVNLSQDKTKWYLELKRLLFIKFCGIKSAVGFEVGTIPMLLRIQNIGQTKISEIQRLNLIVQKLNIPIRNIFPIKPEPNLTLVHDLFNSNELNDSKIISIVIGAKREQNKWPIKSWSKLIELCLNSGFKTIIVGSEEDNLHAMQLQKNGVFNWCGQLSINQTAEVFKRCRLVVSNDTGPMHLAYALDIPVIGLFSAWQLANIWFPPKDKGVTLVDYSVPCALCYSNKCLDNVCLQNISPEIVFEEILKRC